MSVSLSSVFGALSMTNLTWTCIQISLSIVASVKPQLAHCCVIAASSLSCQCQPSAVKMSPTSHYANNRQSVNPSIRRHSQTYRPRIPLSRGSPPPRNEDLCHRYDTHDHGPFLAPQTSAKTGCWCEIRRALGPHSLGFDLK